MFIFNFYSYHFDKKNLLVIGLQQEVSFSQFSLKFNRIRYFLFK